MIAGAVMAPRRRIVVALFLYAVGAYVAWWNLRSWYVPEGHPRAYQPSEVPLVLTLIGGMVGLLAVAGWQLRDGVGRRRVGGARAA